MFQGNADCQIVLCLLAPARVAEATAGGFRIGNLRVLVLLLIDFGA